MSHLIGLIKSHRNRVFRVKRKVNFSFYSEDPVPVGFVWDPISLKTIKSGNGLTGRYNGWVPSGEQQRYLEWV